MATVARTPAEFHRVSCRDLEQGIPTLDGLPSQNSIRQGFIPPVRRHENRFSWIKKPVWKPFSRSLSVPSGKEISEAAIDLERTSTAPATSEASRDSQTVTITTATTPESVIEQAPIGALVGSSPLEKLAHSIPSDAKGILSQNCFEDRSPPRKTTSSDPDVTNFEGQANTHADPAALSMENWRDAEHVQTEDSGNSRSQGPNVSPPKPSDSHSDGATKRPRSPQKPQNRDQFPLNEEKPIPEVLHRPLTRSILSKIRDQRDLHYVSYVKDYPCEEYIASNEVRRRFVSLKPEIQQLINTYSKPAKYASGDATKLYLTLPVKNPPATEPVIVAVCRTKEKADKVLTLILKSNCKSWGFSFKAVYNPTLELKSLGVGNDELAPAEYVVKARLPGLATTSMGLLIDIYETSITEHDNASSLPTETFIGRATLGGMISINGTLYGLTVAHLLATSHNRLSPSSQLSSVEDGLISANIDGGNEESLSILGIVRAYAFGKTVLAPEAMDVYARRFSATADSDWALVEIQNPPSLSDLNLAPAVNRGDLKAMFLGRSPGCIDDQPREFGLGGVTEVSILTGASGVQAGRFTSECVSIQLFQSWFDVATVVLDGPPLVHGDSGAWVIKRGTVYGIVIAGSDFPPQAYVLPFENVLDSISALVPSAVISATDRITINTTLNEIQKPFPGMRGRVHRLDNQESVEPTLSPQFWRIADTIISDRDSKERVRVVVPSEAVEAICRSTDLGTEIVRIESLLTGESLNDLWERTVIFCETEQSRLLFKKCLNPEHYKFLVDATIHPQWKCNPESSNTCGSCRDLVVRASVHPDRSTMCGLSCYLQAVYEKHDGCLIQVTIGGIILVNGELLGLTVLPSSSMAPDHESTSKSPASAASAIREERIHENRLIGSSEPEKEAQSLHGIASVIGRIWSRSHKTSLGLVRLDESLPLPNSVLINHGSSWRLIDGTKSDEDLTKLEDEEYQPEICIATATGSRKGLLDAGNVNMKIPGYPALDVRRVILESPLDERDVGAWVVHDSSLCGVIYATSSSLPWAYMLTIEEVFKDMTSLGLDARLPTLDDLETITLREEMIHSLAVENAHDKLESSDEIQPNITHKGTAGITGLSVPISTTIQYTLTPTALRSAEVEDDEDMRIEPLRAPIPQISGNNNASTSDPGAQIPSSATPNEMGNSDKLYSEGSIHMRSWRKSWKRSLEQRRQYRETWVKFWSKETSMPKVPKQDTRASQGDEMKKSKIAIIMGALYMTVFLVAIDTTIISTALPTIAAHFKISEAGYTWIGSAYMLASAASIPLWVKLSGIWDRKPIILVANIVFLVGSLICALAVSLAMLIVGRVIQGVVGGGLIMLVNLCVFDLFSIRTRPLYFGIAALVWHLGFVLGPVLGGVFAERVSWRWCFYVNLPCGGLAFVILFIFLDIETPKTPFRKGLAAIDWLGSLTIVGGTVMFLLGLEFGGVSFPWASATVICLIIFGVIVLGLFVLNEWKLARYPVIAFRLFKYRSHVAVLSVTFCHSFVFISGPYFLPLYFQSVLATTPILSGVYLLPFVLSLFFLSVSAGIFNLKTGRDLESIHFGLIMMTLGFGLFIDLKPYASWGRIIPFQIIAGIGLGPNFKSPLIALETLVKPQDIATARITLSFIRQLSTSISIVLGGVIFTNGLKNRAHILRSQLPAEVAARIASTSTAPDVVYLRTLPPTQKQVVDSVLTDCLRDMWIFYVCVSALGLFASLFIDRQMLVKHHEKAKTGLDEEKEKEKKGKKEEKEEKEKKEEQEEKEEGEEEEKEQEEGEEAGVAVVTPTLAPEVEKSRDGTS